MALYQFRNIPTLFEYFYRFAITINEYTFTMLWVQRAVKFVLDWRTGAVTSYKSYYKTITTATLN